MNCIYKQVLEQLRMGNRIVLATVIRSSGSTPQKPGSSALFDEKGLVTGTVGGGMLEGEVQHIATSVLITGISDHYYFDLDTDQDEAGAICGGDVVVLVDADPVKHLKALEAMEQSLDKRQGGMLVTVVKKRNGNGSAVDRYWIAGEHPDAMSPEFNQSVRETVLEQYKKSKGAGFRELEPDPSLQAPFEMAFLESIEPLPHLVIAGAGHVGKAVAHLGNLLDFEITVIDDRAEYASRENIPDADHLVVKDIGEAMLELKPGPDTYIVIVTRGHHHDADALKPCTGTDAAYVGMIGSNNKVGILKQKFIEEGWATPEQWSQIHTPIGLDIGSRSIQEIAVSIAAQLVSVRSQKNSKHAG